MRIFFIALLSAVSVVLAFGEEVFTVNNIRYAVVNQDEVEIISGWPDHYAGDIKISITLEILKSRSM